MHYSDEHFHLNAVKSQVLENELKVLFTHIFMQKAIEQTSKYTAKPL